MKMKKTIEQLYEHKIIAIIRGVKPTQMASLADALLKGGICCMEVTFDNCSERGQQETLESIHILKRTFDSQVVLGAGTVLTEQQVCDAQNAGASFIISPNVSKEVITKTKELGMVSIPGAMTPSEVVAAHGFGADIVKLFPAGMFGVSYLKAVRGPLRHIPMMAVGGINPDNIAEFLEAGACGVGIGGNLVNLKYIKDDRYDLISAEAKRFSDAIKI
jgi:2-dehydro-3-deoxyphosphogluconate aldolase/(4S)-4-hydroxy-2-oxoglutarate aldolase